MFARREFHVLGRGDFNVLRPVVSIHNTTTPSSRSILEDGHRLLLRGGTIHTTPVNSVKARRPPLQLSTFLSTFSPSTSSTSTPHFGPHANNSITPRAAPQIPSAVVVPHLVDVAAHFEAATFMAPKKGKEEDVPKDAVKQIGRNCCTYCRRQKKGPCWMRPGHDTCERCKKAGQHNCHRCGDASSNSQPSAKKRKRRASKTGITSALRGLAPPAEQSDDDSDSERQPKRQTIALKGRHSSTGVIVAQPATTPGRRFSTSQVLGHDETILPFSNSSGERTTSTNRGSLATNVTRSQGGGGAGSRQAERPRAGPTPRATGRGSLNTEAMEDEDEEEEDEPQAAPNTYQTRVGRVSVRPDRYFPDARGTHGLGGRAVASPHDPRHHTEQLRLATSRGSRNSALAQGQGDDVVTATPPRRPRLTMAERNARHQALMQEERERDEAGAQAHHPRARQVRASTGRGPVNSALAQRPGVGPVEQMQAIAQRALVNPYQPRHGLNEEPESDAACLARYEATRVVLDAAEANSSAARAVLDAARASVYATRATVDAAQASFDAAQTSFNIALYDYDDALGICEARGMDPSRAYDPQRSGVSGDRVAETQGSGMGEELDPSIDASMNEIPEEIRNQTDAGITDLTVDPSMLMITQATDEEPNWFAEELAEFATPRADPFESHYRVLANYGAGMVANEAPVPAPAGSSQARRDASTQPNEDDDPHMARSAFYPGYWRE
ncbi:hypothetical protein BU16DRAFT_554057 [Lophium mytilinum]|uniref:Uncharacterized protein n=1 Tax=Lophium mytilinum TaxID=390894 RepID=A0A6A6RB20_9PEZI|nr:hypothetical protein BU16DRAFT_554057 [Lophium mytilinum]